MLSEREAITLRQCLFLLFSNNRLLNVKCEIYDAKVGLVRVSLIAEGKLGEMSNRTDLYDKKVINLVFEGVLKKKIRIDTV